MGWTEGAAVVRHAVATGVVPGAVLVAGTRAGARDFDADEADCRIWSGGTLAQGADPFDPASGAIGAGTVFDLASLTKVLATLPVALRLVDTGAIALDDAVEKFLPGFVGPGKHAVTIRHLLSHTSGLPAHRKLYLLPGDPPDLLAAVAAEPLVEPAGTVVCYSDLGFILLGEVIAAVVGSPLDRAAAELVFDPLGLPGLRFRPPPEWRTRIAATEVPPGKTQPTLGTVHDENAAALGGVAGHAGLFGTGADVAACLRKLWLAPAGGSQGSPLSEAVRAESFRCQTDGLTGRRGLGWTLRGDRWDHLSVAWPNTGAGHTGFTGTSVALDPVSGLWAVLLTNAVRLGREKNGIVALRRAVHDALAATSAADQVRTGVTPTPGDAARLPAPPPQLHAPPPSQQDNAPPPRPRSSATDPPQPPNPRPPPRHPKDRPMEPPPSLLIQIKALLPSLPPAEQRVATAAVADPAGVAGKTIRQLAHACDTSETTVVRFCRAIGLRGYPELRIGLAAAAGVEDGTSGFSGIGGDIGPGDSLDDVVKKLGFADSRAVEDTVGQLDVAVLRRVVDAVVAAGRVDVYGVGASALVALDLQQKLHRIGRAAHAWTDRHSALTSAALLKRRDVAIGVSHTGDTPDTFRTLAEAHDNGATTVAITNFPRSRITEVADHVLTTAVRETTYRSGAMASRIAALTVVDCLFVGVAQRDHAKTLKALERTYNAVRERR